MWKKFFCLIIVIRIAKPIQSAILKCSDLSQPIDTCYSYNLTTLSQANEVITFEGQPSTYVNPNTISVWIHDHVLKYFPSRVLAIFPNLDLLSVSNDTLPNCGVLRSFHLSGGSFTNIPAGFLQSCKSLTTLSIHQTNVTTIDVNAFRGLANLTTIDANLFNNLPNLISVHLSGNLITYFPKLNLQITAVQNPLTISIEGNPLTALSPDLCSIYDNGNAQGVFFMFGMIVNCVPINIISIDSKNCRNSDLQNCYANWTSSMNTPVTCGVPPTTTTAPLTTAVVTTPSPTPGSCPSDKICRYFLDQYNRYTCILDGVDSVLTSISGNHLITFADVNVRRVVFTNSFLSRIPPILFQKFTNLEYLTVSNCSMSAINTNTFTACGNLKYFDASSNFITTVDGASFKSCAALEVIDLTGNKFDMISGQLFSNNPNLKAVYINRPPGMVLI